MDSRADPGDGFFRVPLENQTQQEFQFMGSWIPITPRKPVQGRSSLIVNESVIHQELNGVPAGGYEERVFCHKGVYDHGAHQGVSSRNMMTNCSAGSYPQARVNSEREDLLGRSNAASPLAPVIRNTAGYLEPVHGNFTSDAAMVNGFTQSGISQAGYTEFEDDLLGPGQMPISFTSLLSCGDNLFQVHQYGTPACCWPRREADMSICESSFQPVPSTPSLCRTGQENGFLEKITTTGKNVPSIVYSSAVNSTEVTEQKEVSRKNDLGFDLNKTPQQKPSKRKKFMPKVVVEGKPTRKPRKPACQEDVKSKDTGSVKRKKKTNLKESATKKPAIVGDMSNASPRITHKSCRKALNFDLDKPGDARQGDSESEIVQNVSGSNSFSETRDATSGTSGSCLDSVTQRDQTDGLEALAGAKLPRVTQANHTRILARDQPPELSIRNQHCQLPVVTHNTHLPMGIQLLALFDNQQPRMTISHQQPRLAMGNQQPMYLMGTPRPALASGNQQPGGLQGNKRPIFLNQETQQTSLPAGNRQYGSLSGMEQLVMSTGGQQHGLQMNNQQPRFFLRDRQPGSSVGGQQPCIPVMNQQFGTPRGFTHLNQMISASIASPGLRPHSQSQTPTTNLHVESVSRSLNGTAGTCQRSNIPEYSCLQQDIHEYIPSQERSNAESSDVCKKALSQNSSLPTPVVAKHVEARGSKRQYDHAMGQMNPVGSWPLLKQIAQLQDVDRQTSRTPVENLDPAKKMKILKAVQENEDDPTYGATKDKYTASIKEKNPGQVQNSVDNEKCIVPKTPARKGRAVRKKSVAPPAHTSEIQVYEPTVAKKASSRSKAKERGRKSKQDSRKTRGPSGELLDPIAEIIYKLENLNLKSREQEQQNALVIYETKKPRPKVDLDNETTRIWNLLMGKGEKEGDEGMDEKKKKWWEEERRVFRGRADSFISIMHRVQGDRRFSPWKGSVVDSVIGVFLTQNVTDHLSSSAFMSLAARFPPKSSSNLENERNIRSVVVEDPEGCILNSNDIPSWQEKVQNPSDSQVSGVDSGSKEQQRDCSNSGIEKFNFLENSSQNLEEEVLSSCSGSKSDAEFCTTRRETKTVSGSAQSGSSNWSVEICHQGNGNEFLSIGQPSNDTNWKNGPPNPSSSYEQSTIGKPRVLDIEDFGMQGEGIGYSWRPVSPKADRGKKKNAPRKYVRQGRNVAREFTGQIIPSTAHEVAGMGSPTSSSTHQVHQGDAQHNQRRGTQQNEMKEASQLQECLTGWSITDDLLARDRTAEDVVVPRSENLHLLNIMEESNSSDKERMAIEYNETNTTVVREMKGTLADGKKPTSHWDSLRKGVVGNEERKERCKDTMDSIDYEALRRASVSEIADAIKERGMNYMLAVRIKDFLDRIVKDHGAVDLEWLRQVAPEKSKDFLLSIRGLGLKSVECVRLLALQNLAFPVDTNVGRIAVRLGWVPLQTLPESLQIHLLEQYPMLNSIQKYLWPRLCKIDQPTLYELHYQLITFGKVFCTKTKPNCNSCPMRGQCRHFASAYASARLALPAPPAEAPEKMRLTSAIPLALALPPEKGPIREAPCVPIIEEPDSESEECNESDVIEDDAYYNEDPDCDEITTIKLNKFVMTLREHMERNMELQEGDMSKALVALNPATTSIPAPKQKNIGRLRTEHLVYELPDSHPLLDGMDKREPDDPSPYLLAIWTAGETANSAQPPEQKCGERASGKMCFDETCSECNSVREANSQTVRGTLLIPCRTAMRGSFPLNGTYFQVNELFADHESSLKPIDVPRAWLWDLARKIVYFGSSVTSIFRGLSTEQIRNCFWEGFVCVRGFESKTRAPRPLMARLHFSASRSTKKA